MRAILHRARQKPEHHRQRTALLISGGVTLLLFVGWVATLPARLVEFGPSQQASVPQSSPLQSLKQTLNDSLSTLKNDVDTQTQSGLNIESLSSSYVSNGVVISDVPASSSVRTSGSY